MGLLSGLMGSSGAPKPDGALIKDSDTQHFMDDVIQASRAQPVIVDFWAPWCGPCKQLGPMLERVVRNAGGKVRLVKVNVDENPELAQQLRIQSLPTVYGFRGGQPVDGFTGALPESQIKVFVERLVGPLGPGPTEVGLEQAKEAAAAGQLDIGRADLRATSARGPGQRRRPSPGSPAARSRGGASPQRGRSSSGCPRSTSITSRSMARAPRSAWRRSPARWPTRAQLNARLAADENDHEARLDLATVLFLRGQVEAAVEHLLAVVRKDREWHDQAARKQLLKFFDALGPQHPATVSGRRKLATILFS